MDDRQQPAPAGTPFPPDRGEDEDPERRAQALMRWLREEVWPHVPADQIGRRLSREEEDDILGYGPHGV